MTPSDDSVPGGPASTEAIEAAAAAWLSLRDRGMSPEETAGFLRWLQQDPRHAEIFGELDRTWSSFDRLSAVPAAPSPACAGAPPDADLLAPRPRAQRLRFGVWAVLSAAAAIAVLLALAGLVSPAPHHTAETEIGAFRKLDLPDGSVAQLNTDSAIDTEFTPTERRIRIARGEVFFSVAKDPARPFVVSAGPVAVQAVGTAFNVRQRADAIEVLVTHGQVRVDDARSHESVLRAPQEDRATATATPPLLTAGERVLVPFAGAAGAATAPQPTMATIERVSPGAVQRALAWQERRLEFDAATLADVAREFNRYNRKQLVIDDAALAARHFSGTFRADGYESFVRLLEADFGVSVSDDGREIVLRTRR